MSMIKELDSQRINIDRITHELKNLLGEFSLWGRSQVSITSITGDNDWECSVGRLDSLSHPEEEYSVINEALQGSYTEQVINTHFSNFYRWRLLTLRFGDQYTVHSDAATYASVAPVAYEQSTKLQQRMNQKISKLRNRRVHIPIETNPDAYFCYHSHKPGDGVEATIKYHHLAYGKIYEVDTSVLHTAINYGKEPRVHLVGVRYE